MSARDPSGLLRLALRVDAVATAALALLAIVAAPALEHLLGAPAGLLGPLGLGLLAYAVAVWLVAARRQVSRSAAWAAVILNGLWVIDSLVTVVFGWFALTGLGVAFVLAQAVAVAVLADLQFLGLRRAAAAGA